MRNEKGTLAELKRVIEDAHMMVSAGAQPGLLLNRLNLVALDDEGRKRLWLRLRAPSTRPTF